MNARQLRRELHRIARQEVPDGEPDLWSEIRKQIAPRRTLYSSPSGHSNYIRSDSSSGSPELSSVYVWTADQRRGRIGKGTRLLAAGAALVLVVALLAAVLGNQRGSDRRPIGVIASPTSQTPAAAGFGTPAAQTLAWTSAGDLVVPITPAPDSKISGTVHAQILPNGDLRLQTNIMNSTGVVTAHAVHQTCQATTSQSEQDVASNDVIPSFSPTGGYFSFIPEAQTHQAITLTVFRLLDGKAVACVTVPAVPATLNVAFPPAAIVPRTCPVTVPTEPFFTPPASVSTYPPHPIYGDYWYGTDSLWTALPFDGVWSGGRSFWWSAAYSVNAEPQPALTVTAKRLDGDAPLPAIDRATNGSAGGAGSFMLVGVTFPTPGCWQVTGEYRGHSLSFIVWVTDNAGASVNQAPGPVPAASPAAGPDGLTHTDLTCRASSFGPSTATPADINVEFGGRVSSGQFWALLFQEMPLYANQSVEFAWKIGSPDPLTLTIEDVHGNRIRPSSGPSPSTSQNWPRPGSEWLSKIVFPHSGCWHVQASAGTVTGDMWFEVFSPPITPAPAAMRTAGSSGGPASH